jgi:hypothetical protein
MEPRETHVVAAGRYFVHPYWAGDCRTECPAPQCTCGHFRLKWPQWEAMVAERQTRESKE